MKHLSKKELFSIPNLMGYFRLVMIPVFVWLYLHAVTDADYYRAAMVMGISSITDMFDGMVARKFNMITEFGKFLDPLADKLLVVSAMLWFVQIGRMPAWCVLIVVAREFAVTGLRLVAVDNGRVIAAGWSGKVKTATTMVCICLMLAFQGFVLDWVCTAVIVITTVYSGIEYFVKNKDVINWRDM